MFLHFQVLFHTLLFVAVMEAAAINNDWILYLAIFLSIFSLWSIKKISKRFIFSTIPIALALSSIIMLYLIDLKLEKHVFVALTSIIYYLSLLGVYRLRQYDKDQTARGMVAASATTALFFSYAASYGIYLNFAIPLWVLMIFFLGITTLVSYEYFIIINEEKKRVLNYSIVLGMIMAEIAWVVNFWPFGYLTTGVIVLIFYYIFWDLTQSHFLNILSQKRLVANIIFFSFIIGIILTTSKWLPVV